MVFRDENRRCDSPRRTRFLPTCRMLPADHLLDGISAIYPSLRSSLQSRHPALKPHI